MLLKTIPRVPLYLYLSYTFLLWYKQSSIDTISQRTKDKWGKQKKNTSVDPSIRSQTAPNKNNATVSLNTRHMQK